jgi:hypothetical protein
MAQKFLTNIDLNQNELRNGKFQLVGTDPTTGNFEGRLIYNSTEDTIKVFTGSVWRKMIHGVSSGTTALTSSETNGAVTLSIANVVAAGASGLMTGADKTKLDNATATETPNTLVLRDANGRFKAANPSADLDVANKSYVDAARQGLDVKASVRLTTNAPLPAYSYDSGVITGASAGVLLIDGVQPGNNERVLVKDETGLNAPYNGIYDVTDYGNGGPYVLTRSDDANTDAKVTPGMFTFVEGGNTWGDSGWLLTNDTIPIVLGTTPLTFVQFSAAGQTIAGNGLVKTGNAIDVVGTDDRIVANADSIDIAATYVGQTSITTLGTIGTGTWAATDVAVEHGGTGSSTESGARTNLAVGGTQGVGVSAPVLSRTVALTIGDGANTVYTVQHGFGTRDVAVQVYDIATYETVVTDVVRTDTNNVTVSFSSIPASNTYRVVVTG